MVPSPLRALVGASALSLTLLAAVPGLPGAAAGSSAATGASPLRLLAPTSITGEPGRHALSGLDLRVTAPGDPVEIWSSRASWADPVVTVWRSAAGDVALPESRVGSFDRLITVSLRRPDGTLVARRKYDACAASPAQAAVAPGAPATSPYPRACPDNAFALGSVVGVQSGWANALDDVEPRLRLAAGSYVVTTRIARPWADALGISTADAVRTTDLTVARTSSRARAASAALRALPAGHLRVVDGHLLRFDATVWNAGPDAATGAPQVYRLFHGGQLLRESTADPARLRHQSPVDLTVAGAEWVPSYAPGRLPVGWGTTVRGVGDLDLDGLRSGVYRLEVSVGGEGDGHAVSRLFETIGPPDDRRIRVLPVGHVTD